MANTATNTSDIAAETSAPNVIVLKKKKRKKYSKGLKNLQKGEDRLGKATHRISKAIEKGIGEYRDRRKDSAADRKDGAIVDFVPNVAGAWGIVLEKSSRVPYDLSRIVSNKRRRKITKRVARGLNLRFFW